MKLRNHLKTRKFRNDERGVTMVLMAIAMVSLLAMVALAIDITTLYVAQSQTQSAADAAALAGAKMFVTSGFTSVQTAGPPPVLQSDVCQNGGPGNSAAANRQAEAAAAQNNVAGQAATIQTIACDFAQPGNPRITVTVQRTALPTFFARIWNGAASNVTATATAEAYNASGLNAPIQVESVKPWLVPNCDPTHTAAGFTNPNCVVAGGQSSYFIDPATGAVANGGQFIGRTITFQRTNLGSSPKPPSITAEGYYPIDIPINPPTAACPDTGAVSCNQVGGDNYRDNIACASKFRFSCGDAVGIGQNLTIYNAGGTDSRTRQGVDCLIHGDPGGGILGAGQDAFTPTGGGPPITISAGYNNPNPTLAAGSPLLNISRSDSVVTVPVYDGGTYDGGTNLFCSLPGPVCSPTATIRGFLQLGITQSAGGADQFAAVILNAVGCNPGASGNPVSGGDISAIPVRLIHN